MELAGIIIAGAGLVALESTVEDIFTKISTWRHHGEDYQQLSLDLELAKMAYQRWHRTVRLVDLDIDTGPLLLPVAAPSEAATVQRLLGAIAAAFEDVEKTSRRYETEADADDPPMTEADEKKSPTEMLIVKVRAANKARQTGTGAVGKLRWVFHDKKALETLVEKVGKNVKQLVKLFPAATGKIQEGLATLEIMDIVPANEADEANERRQLVQLLDAAKKVDPILEASTNESIRLVDQRHSFKNVRADGKGRILNGDEIADGATAPGGSGHTYEDISASGESCIQNGDRVGGRSFWDD